MSMSSHELVAFAEERLDAILARPGMWGRSEAVEMQVLLLLEILVFAETRPSVANPRAWLNERYAAFRRRHVPRDPPTLLAGHFASDLTGLAALLGEFRDELEVYLHQPYEQRPTPSEGEIPELEDVVVEGHPSVRSPMPRAEV